MTAEVLRRRKTEELKDEIGKYSMLVTSREFKAQFKAFKSDPHKIPPPFLSRQFWLRYTAQFPKTMDEYERRSCRNTLNMAILNDLSQRHEE